MKSIMNLLAAFTATLLFTAAASGALVAEFNYNAGSSPGNATTGSGTSSGAFFPFSSSLPEMTGSPADMGGVMVNGGLNNSSAGRSGPQPGETSGTRLFGVNTSLAGYETPKITWDMLTGYRGSRYYQMFATSDGTNFSLVPNNGTGSSVSGSNGTATVSNDGLITVTTIDGLIDARDGTGYLNDLSFTFPTGTAYDNNPDFGVRIAAVWRPNGTDFVSSFAGTDATDTVAGYIRDTSLGGNQNRYDLVRVDANVIPEPSSVALFGIGLLMFRIRRKR